MGAASTATWARAASKGRAASIGRRASGVSGAGARTDSLRRKASTCRARRASAWDCHAGGTSTMLHSTMSTMRTMNCTLQQHFYGPTGNVTPPAERAGGCVNSVTKGVKWRFAANWRSFTGILRKRNAGWRGPRGPGEPQRSKVTSSSELLRRQTPERPPVFSHSARSPMTMRAVGRLAHVVDGQRGDRAGGERLHLDAGAVDGLDLGLDLDVVVLDA